MSMVQRICKWRGCRAKFTARSADVKRGWGNFCSKSCKANEQESRTGQYKSLSLLSGSRDTRETDHEIAQAAIEDGWDGHKEVAP